MKIYEYFKNYIKDLKVECNSIKIEPLKINKNYSYILVIFTLLFYEIQYYYWPDKITNFFLYTLNMNIYLYFFILDLITLLIVLLAHRKELNNSLSHFKINFKSFCKYLFFTLIIYAYISAILALICNLIVGDIPDNQASLENYNYLYLLFASLIYAPVVEETIYRGTIRKFIKNDKLFIIISGIIFGLVHVIGSSSLIQYIYILDYGFTGMYLAFLYTKYNNIYLNISTHFIINLIAIISIFIRIII